MPCIAQFGIINEFEKSRDYSTYEPEKYQCVGINDDYLDDWWEQLSLLKTYFHCYERPAVALARWGITLIPPESLELLYNIVSSDSRSSSLKELVDLMQLIRKASSENKYMIHYGV